MSRGAGGGRPSKADLAQRARRKRAWSRTQEQRRQTESRIQQGLVEVIPWEEAVNRRRAGTLKDDVIVIGVQEALLSATEQLLAKKLGGIRLEQLDDAAMRRILMEVLVETQDEATRRVLADELERFVARTPEQRKRDADCAKVKVIRWSLKEAERRGWVVDPELSDGTPDGARDQIAVLYGFPSGEALLRFMERNRSRDDA
jgi:hypothetical protein